MASEINLVSPERIAMEMRRMLVDPNRATAVRLMLETGLAEILLPEIVPHDPKQHEQFDHGLDVLTRLAERVSPRRAPTDAMRSMAGWSGEGPGVRAAETGFPLALAALLYPWADADQTAAVCKRWRLSNKETERAVWLVAHRTSLEQARSMRWSAVQPILITEGIGDLLLLMEAVSPGNVDAVGHCRSLLAQSPEILDPPPLLAGEDLLTLGIPPGPRYKVLLQHVRDAQLDQKIGTKAEALAVAEKWLVSD
jgi:poly(A) polymerase